jgi:hypothetical protein
MTPWERVTEVSRRAYEFCAVLVVNGGLILLAVAVRAGDMDAPLGRVPLLLDAFYYFEWLLGLIVLFSTLHATILLRDIVAIFLYGGVRLGVFRRQTAVLDIFWVLSTAFVFLVLATIASNEIMSRLMNAMGAFR